MITPSQRSAFSLTEMVVVIAVAVILGALLLPMLQKARAQYNSTVCVHNLRNIGAGIQAYAVDHDGYLPVNNAPVSADGIRWYLSLNPYVGKASVSSANDGWARPSVFICPGNDPKSDYTKYAIFSDATYWSNTFLMPRYSGGSSGSWTSAGGPVRLSQVSGNRIIVADNPKLSGATRYMCYFSNMSLANSTRPYGTDDLAMIHRDGVNALFVDMSVRHMLAIEINKKGSELPEGPYFGN